MIFHYDMPIHAVRMTGLMDRGPMPKIPLLVFLILLGGEAMAFQIESPDFKEQEKIPQKFTCDGADVSPALFWKETPEGTKSFALISDDPDAPMGTWVHWVAYNIPADTRELREGVSKKEILPDGTKQGITDFKEVGYGGPCPPPGPQHRYFFKLYALDAALDLPPRVTKADLLVAMNGHILAQADLVGLYQRK